MEFEKFVQLVIQGVKKEFSSVDIILKQNFDIEVRPYCIQSWRCIISNEALNSYFQIFNDFAFKNEHYIEDFTVPDVCRDIVYEWAKLLK